MIERAVFGRTLTAAALLAGCLASGCVTADDLRRVEQQDQLRDATGYLTGEWEAVGWGALPGGWSAPGEQEGQDPASQALSGLRLTFLPAYLRAEDEAHEAGGYLVGEVQAGGATTARVWPYTLDARGEGEVLLRVAGANPLSLEVGPGSGELLLRDPAGQGSWRLEARRGVPGCGPQDLNRRTPTPYRPPASLRRAERPE